MQYNRPAQRHRNAADAGDAPGHVRGRSRRRRLPRGPHRQPAGGAGRRAAGQGGRAVRPRGHDGQPGAPSRSPGAGEEVIVRGREPRLPVTRSAGSPRSPAAAARLSGAAAAWIPPRWRRRSGPTTCTSRRTGLVCVENTHNRSGGCVYPRRMRPRGRGRAHGTASPCTWTAPASSTPPSPLGRPRPNWPPRLRLGDVLPLQGAGRPGGLAAGRAPRTFIAEARRLPEAAGRRHAPGRGAGGRRAGRPGDDGRPAGRGPRQRPPAGGGIAGDPRACRWTWRPSRPTW